MKLSSLIKIGTVTEPTTKLWKKEPSNFTFACQAAAVFAKKHNSKMVVIPGNSYMQRVFHIAKPSDPIQKFFGYIPEETNVAVVDEDGNVFKAKASK